MLSDITPSLLPSFLLPCPLCGSRLAIAKVAAPRYIDGDDFNDLEDVTYTCVQCGTALITTRRQLPDTA
jgi:DNA-directed RNA polymerase subunit RPC12/RpoP